MRCVVSTMIGWLRTVRAAAIKVVEVASRMMHCVFESRRYNFEITSGSPICGGGIPTINVRMQMVCTFIGTFCKYTTCIMRSLKRCSWGYWSAVDCDGRATVVQVGWRRCCLEDCRECCSSLGLARWGVLFSEARWSQRVDLADSH
jgi:hypothetical protein